MTQMWHRSARTAPHMPTPVWGRDELATGEMWNSNSVIAWLIARSGLDVESIHAPAGGRAPGWSAGLIVARRQETLLGSVGRAPASGKPPSRLPWVPTEGTHETT